MFDVAKHDHNVLNMKAEKQFIVSPM